MKSVKCTSIKGNTVIVPKNQLVFRPSVYAVITDGTEILMLKNKTSKKFFFPGGGINIGEKLETALHREVKEETGINIVIGELLHFNEQFFYYDPLDEAFHSFNFFFMCRPITQELLSDDEVDDLESIQPQWLNIPSLMKRKKYINNTAQKVLDILSEKTSLNFN